MKKKYDYSAKEIIGEVMTLTYEHLWATILVIVALIGAVIGIEAKSLTIYGKQLAYLERTLDAGLTPYQVEIWVCDIVLIFIAIITFIYISELFRYHTKISLFERMFGIDLFAEDDNEEE